MRIQRPPAEGVRKAPDVVVDWASTYGAAGSLVLILLWVYYASLILFFGAALTTARVLAAGKAVVPRTMAVRVREEVVEEDGPSHP